MYIRFSVFKGQLDINKIQIEVYFQEIVWKWSRNIPICQLLGVVSNNQGAVSIRKTVLPGMAIPMLKIRRPNGRLIFNMEITIRR